MVNGENYDLTLADFEILSEDIPGWQVANDGPLTVALDISIDDDLKAEGNARELVNRIQNIRKSKDFEVTDKIIVELSALGILEPALEKYGAYIKGEVLAVEITMVPDLEGGEEVQIGDDDAINIQVRKA
jgi:isoleucyl-tRNA synthetase